MAIAVEWEARALFGPDGPVLPRLAERWAEPRAEPTRLGQEPRRPYALPAGARRTGGPEDGSGSFSAELQVWCDLFDRFELETADPAEAELRALDDLPDLGDLLDGCTGPSALADLFGIFTASTVVIQQDALAYLASLAGTPLGVSRVYVFHPEDWGLHRSDASVSARLFRLEEAASRSAHPFGSGSRPREADEFLETLRAALPVFEASARKDPSFSKPVDPEYLGTRADWVVRALVGLPFRAALENAATLEDFEREAPLIGSHPHLALYWLFHHGFLNNAEGAARCAELAGPAVESDRHVRAAADFFHARARGEQARIGPFTEVDDEAVREVCDASAPHFARERRPTGSDLGQLRDPLLSTLDDEDGLRFLELFEHLGDSSPLGPGPFADRPPETLEEELADRAEPRFLSLLDAALKRGTRVQDHHADAGRGRILARAALCASYEEFTEVLDQVGGTENFGPRRRDELWRAIASFSDASATARLAEGAAAFAKQAEDWIRTASKVPWNALLARDTLQTHELVVRFLAETNPSKTSAPLFVEAARAAERHHITRAVPGLRRALACRVGDIRDGGRTAISAALVELDQEAGPFLSAIGGALKQSWEDTNDEAEAFERALALACVVGPRLAVAPDDPEVRATAAALLSQFAVRLAPDRSPGPDLFEAVRALVEGARQGEVTLLFPTLQALAELMEKTARRTRRERTPASERLRAALRRAARSSP